MRKQSAPCFHLAVLHARAWTRSWLPVVLWMVLIFSGSTDLLSSEHTSRVIGPVLRWFKPDISDEAIKNVQFVIRKSAHMTEYAVLAFLFWRALRSSRIIGLWSWRQAAIALGLAIGYSVTDEIHQAFVKSRMGSGWDVLIDTGGAALGLFLLWRFGRTHRYW